MNDRKLLQSTIGWKDNWEPSVGRLVYNSKDSKLYLIGTLNKEKATLLNYNDAMFNYWGYADVIHSLTSDIVPYFEMMVRSEISADYDYDVEESDDLYIDQRD